MCMLLQTVYYASVDRFSKFVHQLIPKKPLVLLIGT